MVIIMEKLKFALKEEEKVLDCVGERIRDLRMKRRMTQDELAELADISSRNLSDIENGKVDCHLTTLYAISKAFNISLSEMFDELQNR